ncbi:hypothetical protein LWI29_030510 [Acer saccharum]|uniref:SWIM-type domain-containing protein n=1 Tax=Acer saccharum TaxID=4024 RepID=A0AA39TIK8_ACESA|nr:hypothetical protein LWI29_030510 [Acer saccharum]
MGPFFKDQIFDTKQKLKNEFGKYALTEKFNPRIRRSTKYQFEAGCNDIKCDFALRATCRGGCTYWVVRKFAHDHTCSLDTYESHFRKVSSIVAGEMFAPKLNTNGRTIRPIYIITEMREQHGVQLLYTKAWWAKEHAKNVLYRKPEDSYQLREQAGKNPTYLVKATVGHCKERNKWSLTYHVYPIELTKYLVKDGKYDGPIDIEQRMCTCRNWDLDQLPCDHAISIARFTKTNFNSCCSC